MFRWVDHTSELELEIHAPSETEVFTEALTALSELLTGAARASPEQRLQVRVRAGDRAALLAAWLEELIFLAESAGLEPVRAEALELSSDALTATVVARAGAPPPLAKAVTYHHLTFVRTEDGYRATVVLDV